MFLLGLYITIAEHFLHSIGSGDESASMNCMTLYKTTLKIVEVQCLWYISAAAARLLFSPNCLVKLSRQCHCGDTVALVDHLDDKAGRNPQGYPARIVTKQRTVGHEAVGWFPRVALRHRLRLVQGVLHQLARQLREFRCVPD
jgi:hypothetical protein